MRKSLIVAALVSTTMMPSPGWARDGGGYVGVDAGAMIPQDLELDFDSDTTSVDNIFEVDLNNGFDVDLVAGYDFGPFRLEGEVAYKRASINEVLVSPQVALLETRAEGDGRAAVLSGMVNALIDFEDDRWGGSAGAGAGIARTKLRADISDSALPSAVGFSGQDSAFAWQALASIRYAVTKNIDLGLKYRFFRTKFDLEESGDRLAGRFRSHSLLASLIYNFAAPADAPVPAPVAPLPPAPPPPATQTCPDGSVILATDSCLAPTAPPPPPPPAPERG